MIYLPRGRRAVYAARVAAHRHTRRRGVTYGVTAGPGPGPGQTAGQGEPARLGAAVTSTNVGTSFKLCGQAHGGICIITVACMTLICDGPLNPPRDGRTSSPLMMMSMFLSHTASGVRGGQGDRAAASRAV